MSLNIFNMITVPVCKDLDASLSSYFEPELIPDYLCSKCNKTGSSVKITRPFKWPSILIIQIQRIEMNSNGSLTKNQAAMEFPTTNAFRPFSSNFEYKLKSVVEHYGGVGSGHYAAYRKADDDTGNWFECSDISVRRLSSIPAKCKPYLLFYENHLNNI